MLELAELVLQLTGFHSTLIFMSFPQDDSVQRKLVIDLAKKELSWEPKIPLKNGRMPTIEYFEAELISETAIKKKGSIG